MTVILVFCLFLSACHTYIQFHQSVYKNFPLSSKEHIKQTTVAGTLTKKGKTEGRMQRKLLIYNNK